MGRDYRGCMIQFINWLNEQDYNVLLIANAAREGSEKPRNNDLIICTEVYNAVRDKTKVMWEPREMAPEEIRELLARCEVLVASRFHAMIGALENALRCCSSAGATSIRKSSICSGLASTRWIFRAGA